MHFEGNEPVKETNELNIDIVMGKGSCLALLMKILEINKIIVVSQEDQRAE